MPRLVDQMQEALSAFADVKTPPALIGGLALAVHHVVRATRDIDFLVDADDADRLHTIMLALGYDCVHRSEDAANYLRGDEGLDLLYARRPESMQLLLGAPEHQTGMGRLRVVDAEGLIGFKLQAHVNDPRRLRDVDDIRELMRTNRESLDLQQVRRYFVLFNREAMLNDILDELST
ncbi:MAG: nucleotidyltransferase family protein [Dokdonella sp.]